MGFSHELQSQWAGAEPGQGPTMPPLSTAGLSTPRGMGLVSESHLTPRWILEPEGPGVHPYRAGGWDPRCQEKAQHQSPALGGRGVRPKGPVAAWDLVVWPWIWGLL